MTERTLGEITVNDITETSGLARSTFYKHFDDKYELVGWMLPSDRLFELAASVGDRGYDDVMEDVLTLIEEWRAVYMNAVADPYRELVYSKIFSHTYGFYQTAFAADEDRAQNKTESFIRQLTVKQITDFLLSWVLGEADLTREEVLQVMKRLWPENIFK